MKQFNLDTSELDALAEEADYIDEMRRELNQLARLAAERSGAMNWLLDKAIVPVCAVVIAIATAAALVAVAYKAWLWALGG